MTRLATRLSFALFALSLTTPQAAQALVGTVAGPSPTDLHNRCMATNNRALAVSADGTLWTLFYRDDGQGSRTINLRYSTDAGKTWKGAFPTAASTARPSSLAALAFDRTCNVLHVGWAAVNGGTYYNAYHRTFDTVKKQWLGTTQLLAKGYAGNNQFYVQDIAVTPKGTVAIAINGHRQGGYGLTSWSTGLLVKKAADKKFPPTNNTTSRNLLQMNSGSGTGCNLQVRGEEIHCAFRDTPGGYGPRYSVFDTVSMRYTTKGIPAGPGNNTRPPAGAGSVYSFLMDRAGGKYILWPSGIVSGSTIAALRLAYAPPGKGRSNGDWTDTQIFNDPTRSPKGKRITGGNTSERWFTLTYAGTDGVNILYSKPSEDFRNLYWELWKNGKRVIGPIAPVRSVIDNKFEWVSGMRNYEVESAGTFLVWGERNQSSTPKNSGVVTFWRIGGSGGRSVEFGTACQGKLPQAPRLTANTYPVPNGSVDIQFDRHPASASSFLAFGTRCQLPRLHLQFLGAPDCYLDIDFPVIVGLAVNASGTLKVNWKIPGTLKVGDKIYLQNFVLAKGANSGGAVTSNALGLLF